MDSGFHTCGFRIPHPWITDSISGWIPDLKILFFLCTLFSQKKLVLFFCFSSSFVLYKTILGLTREDCKYRPQRFLTMACSFFSFAAPVCLTMFLQTLPLVVLLWENTKLLVRRQVPSLRYLHLHPAAAIFLEVLEGNVVPV